MQSLSLFITVVLAQSVEHVPAEFDSQGWANTQGLKITEK